MNKIQWTLSNNAYSAPTAIEIYQQRMNYLIETGKHKYSQKWAFLYGPGSSVNTDGLTLLHEYKINEGVTTFSYYEGKKTSVLVENSISGRYTNQEDMRVGGQFTFTQSATTALAGTHLVNQLKSKLKAPEHIEEDDRLPVGFWRMTPQGADRDVRMISYQPWGEISDNYPARSRETLDSVVSTTPATLDGKIALFYGPAGTGKTTFLRALADAWRGWADLEYIIDPEVFLNDPGYITEVMMGGSDDRHSVVLLEDSGELIKEDAKQTSGQALSRLLNMTDGLLGAGRNIIVAITTNDDIAVMHPAVTRPGRCMVKAELGAFPPAEARAWQQNNLKFDAHRAYPLDSMTLAELYHQRGKGVADTHEEPQGSGEGTETTPQVLGSSHSSPAVADARCEPRNPASHL